MNNPKYILVKLGQRLEVYDYMKLLFMETRQLKNSYYPQNYSGKTGLTDYISKEYVELSQQRLKNYKAEEKYVYEEIAKHVVAKTFKERKEKGESTGKYGKQNKKEQSLLNYL